jgi:hypothetical protein
VPHKIIALALFSGCLYAAPPCPAGMPLGAIQLALKRADPTSLPINRINRIEEGDEILYAPVLKPNEKRGGSVALVLVSSRPDHDFVILESKDADKPAQWKAPFQASLAVYVYGPSGLSTRKLKGFLSKDQELIAQLADYAEKTAQTEAVLQAIATYDTAGHTESLGAALQGFAGQYGISNKIDRNAPMNEQTLAALRTLNPALSAYDPISPSGAQRLSQTAGLAATVAGMFLGSTVGLAAGSTAMALNLKTLMFPDTDFRSAYSGSSKADSVALCTTREPQKSRKRIGYLWALRIPDTDAPPLKIEEPNHLPQGMKTLVRLNVPDPQWKFVSRVRNWALQPENGDPVAVPVNAVADQRSIEVNVGASGTPEGKYKLVGLWDWDPVRADGDIFIEPLGEFSGARITPDSQNRMQEHSGKQLITLEGADFEFLNKAEIVRSGDKYASPAAVPFTLPLGPGRGPQNTVELQIDTTNLIAGEYTLLLYQRDGKRHKLDMKVLLAPPKLNGLPLTINQGEADSEVVLEGEGVDRITDVASEGLQIDLGAADAQAQRRIAHVRQTRTLSEGTGMNLRVSVKDYAQPLIFANALLVAGPKPRIQEASPSLPTDLQIGLHSGELPAGVHLGIMMRVAHAGPEPAIELGCKDSNESRIKVQAGSEKSGIKLQAIQAGSLFLSLDPGLWPNGCSLAAILHSKNAGKSDPIELGRIIRLPHIDKFQLTDEPAGEGNYIGILTGNDLELIGQVGWTADSGKPVVGLPVPIVGEGAKQSLKVQLAWPSPTPRAPLFVWFRGEDQGRPTTIRQ